MDVTALTQQFLTVLAGCPRVIGLVALAPVFGAVYIPVMVRFILAGALAIALSSLVTPTSVAVLERSPQAYLAVLISELALGAIVGFLLSCLLEAARVAGEMVDLQIGFRASELFDPLGNRDREGVENQKGADEERNEGEDEQGDAQEAEVFVDLV